MLTPNFSFKEMVSTTHSELQQENVDKSTQYLHYLLKVAIMLQKIRDFINRPVFVSSGFRCDKLNKKVGGAATSQHLLGQAADITIKDYEDIEKLKYVFYWCKNNLDYGELILENKPGSPPWIHISIPREGLVKQCLIYENNEYKAI